MGKFCKTPAKEHRFKPRHPHGLPPGQQRNHFNNNRRHGPDDSHEYGGGQG
ncbi:unnamed protein product, partial [Rotaria magnacalcarata]